MNAIGFDGGVFAVSCVVSPTPPPPPTPVEHACHRCARATIGTSPFCVQMKWCETCYQKARRVSGFLGPYVAGE